MESRELPLLHKRIGLLQCLAEKLALLSPARIESMNLVTVDGNTYHLDSAAVDTEKKTVTVCRTYYISLAHALKTKKPPLQTFAFYDCGVIPARIPKLSLAETIATSRNIVLQLILNLRPLNGVSQETAKGHAISLPLSGIQSLATVLGELPRGDLSDHIRLVIVAKKNLWKLTKQLVRRGGPLRCDPHKVMITLQYRKGVDNKNYEDIKIPSANQVEKTVGMLNQQIRHILDTAIESDSLIAERLATNQRYEVEDSNAGLCPDGYKGVIIRGVMLTDAPQADNPISMVLKSLKKKIDNAKESTKVQSRKDAIETYKVSQISSKKSKPLHKVYIRDCLMNEYMDNPELIGVAFADLFPLGLTKDDLGSSGTLPARMVKTWFLSRDRRFAKHRAFNHFIFNQRIRHETNLKVSLRVKGNDRLTEKLTHLVNEPDFERKLSIAVKDENSPEAREINKKVIPFLKIVGSQVSWSSLERANTLTRLYAMNQFFGTSFMFVTISPSMRNAPLAIRMCNLSDGQEFELPPMHVRTQLIADHPIIAARVFDRMMRAFFEIICGFPLDHFTGRKTNVDRLLKANSSRYIGAFGRLKGVYSIIEDQTGGSLHMHGHL